MLFYTHDSDPAGARSLSRPSPRTSPRSRPTICGRRPARCTASCSRSARPGRFDVDVVQFSEIAHGHRLPEARRLRAATCRREDAAYPADASEHARRLLLLGRRHLRRHRLQHGPCARGGGAEELEGPARSPLAQRDQLQAVDVRHAVRAVVRAEAALRRRLLEGVRQAAPARLRFARPVVRPPRQGRRQGLRAWPSGPATSWYKEQGAESSSWRRRTDCPRRPPATGVVNKAPHPEAAKLFLDWLMSPRGQDDLPDQQFLYYGSLAQGRAADAGRHEAQRLQAALPDRHGRTSLAATPTFVKEWNAHARALSPPCRGAR